MNIIGKIDFENDPEKRMYLFIAYGVSQGISLLIAGIIYLRIKSKNEKELIHIKNTGVVANAQAVVDKDTDGNEVITQTIMEYDMDKVKQMFGNTFLTIGVSIFLYYKFQIIKPLAVQSLFAFKNLLEQPLVSIHIFGKKATGELARPFKSSNILGPKEEAVSDKEVKRMEKKKN
ncbi:hypothetical protein BCR36DRAFT_587827 [Piromyces finnis]|uniref:Inorganic phosphate transport PHO88 n=1 Tax=Piromyces finnis TaxID=1754191 RepID=A0A1Y1UUM4_9FUNG|nr:hypothetical protein BCR36DRAFT_587827 [Piromyces finnis]|eukprot:ORX41720.1 hypothetical protein BCR36DRAFT_587827 [Piromyces finnis]